MRIGGDVEILNGRGENSTTLGGHARYGKALVEIAGDVAITNGKQDDATTIGGYGSYGLRGSRLVIDGDLAIDNGNGDDSTVIGREGGYYGTSYVDIEGDVEVRMATERMLQRSAVMEAMKAIRG